MSSLTLNTLLSDIDALKAQLDDVRPLPPELLADLRQDWEITHTYHSNAIEGNTLTLGETKAILLDGITIAGKGLREHLEVVNHREAMRLMMKLATTGTPIKVEEILNLHRVILTGIQTEAAGLWRTVRVRVAGSERIFPNLLKVPELMAEFVADVNTNEAHLVVRAANAHYGLVAVHPFVDGNGRTARLLMNLSLLRAGYVPTYLPVEQRGDYYDALEAANNGNTVPFQILIAEAVAVSLKRVLDVLL